MAFPHENLAVYREALKLLADLDALCAKLPRYRYYLVKEIRRAALSFVLNTAEGSAETSAPEKVRFYRMARRSVAETAAAADVARTLEPAAVGDIQVLKSDLEHFFTQFTRLMRTQRNRT